MVEKCYTCVWWQKYAYDTKGKCNEHNKPTDQNFGCAKWKKK
ncbi:MAG: hypothetical protein WCO51_04950 [bacterium]